MSCKNINAREVVTIRKGPQVNKFCGSVAVAVQHWSNFEEIPHIQGQRRSPSKIVGGASSHLESNQIPARDAQRAQTNLVRTRTQRPHRD